MTGETGGGGGREGPSPRDPLIPFPGGDSGDPRYNENGAFWALSFSETALLSVTDGILTATDRGEISTYCASSM